MLRIRWTAFGAKYFRWQSCVADRRSRNSPNSALAPSHVSVAWMKAKRSASVDGVHPKRKADRHLRRRIIRQMGAKKELRNETYGEKTVFGDRKSSSDGHDTKPWRATSSPRFMQRIDLRIG
jgi:hypothetical protein